MRIAVIGAGAMGCLYGGLLARAGHDVTLVDGWAAHVAAIGEGGLRLDGLAGDLVVRLPATATAPQRSGSLPRRSRLPRRANPATRPAATAYRMNTAGQPVATGIRNRNVLPAPTSDSSSRVPPCASTMSPPTTSERA